MQMYKGLPIITNKISEKEQRGIPHHLLGNVGLDEETWTVGVFKREASKIIQAIRSRGRLPIVVGGTHYYTNGLLFEDNLVDDSPRADGDGVALEDFGSKFPILEGPTEEMMKELRQVDPVMADRWHPNDRRKIRRSLEIYLTTGKRASDIYAEQQARKEFKRDSAGGSGDAQGPWQSLLFWVYSEPAVLKERLNRRVDKMLDNGLLDETEEVYQHLQRRLAAGDEVDRTKGIWQSIGFKEFEPYLEGAAQGGRDESELAALKQAGVADTQTATRQYAKYQVKWITKKTLPLLREEQVLDRLYLLDSTDISRWNENVVTQGADLTKKFLTGEPLPPAVELSDTARAVLEPRVEAAGDQRETPCNKVCDVCNVTVLTEERWEMHVQSRRHRRQIRRAKRNALVPRRRDATSLVAVEEPSSSEEIGLGQELLDAT